MPISWSRKAAMYLKFLDIISTTSQYVPYGIYYMSTWSFEFTTLFTILLTRLPYAILSCPMICFNGYQLPLLLTLQPLPTVVWLPSGYHSAFQHTSDHRLILHQTYQHIYQRYHLLPHSILLTIGVYFSVSTLRSISILQYNSQLSSHYSLEDI